MSNLRLTFRTRCSILNRRSARRESRKICSFQNPLLSPALVVSQIGGELSNKSASEQASDLVDKADIGSAIGVAAGMAGAAVSWLVGLGAITILISVGIGSLLTFLVQSKTQKNAWKREGALRKIDEIYGPLYLELNSISGRLEAGESTYQYRGLGQPSGPTWASIRPGYHYYLIDTDLRKELDEFFDLYGELGRRQQKEPSIVEAKLIPRLKMAFGEDVEAASCFATAVHVSGTRMKFASVMMFQLIIEGMHPLEYIKEQYAGYSDYQLGVDLQRRGTTKTLFSADAPDEEAGKKFDEVVTSTIREVAEDPTIVWVKKTVGDSAKSAESLKEKIRKKIEEPWNI